MRVLLRIALVCLLACTFGCTPSARQIQAQSAGAVAAGANASLAIAIERYRAQSLRAVDRAKTEAEARKAFARIDAIFEPIFKAFKVLRAAQDGWATALEEGGDTAGALEGMKKAYCGLEAVWPAELRAMPFSLVRCPKRAETPAPDPKSEDAPASEAPNTGALPWPMS